MALSVSEPPTRVSSHLTAGRPAAVLHRRLGGDDDRAAGPWRKRGRRGQRAVDAAARRRHLWTPAPGPPVGGTVSGRVEWSVGGWKGLKTGGKG